MELTEQERETLLKLVTDYATTYHRDNYADIKQRLTGNNITWQQAEEEADRCDNYLADYRVLINKLKGN